MTRTEKITYQTNQYNVYLTKALDLFNEGFKTKADQKRVNDYINRAYETLRDVINDTIIQMRDDKEITNECTDKLFWNLPFSLHQVRTKHFEIYGELFSDEIKSIKYLMQLREEVKNTPIVKVEKTMENKVHFVERSVLEILEKRISDYERGLELAKIFKNLPITVAPHWVFREGTHYKRCFYYMAGKLTALNTIIAIFEKLEDGE